MPLTDAQKAEADKLGLDYDLYEKLQNVDVNALARAAGEAAKIGEQISGLKNVGTTDNPVFVPTGQTPVSIFPGGKLDIPIQIQGAQFGDTVMPSYTTITYAPETGKAPVIINANNPYNIPTTQEGLNNLVKGAVSITDDRVGDIPVPAITDTPLNIAQNTIYTVFVNLSGANYSAAFNIGGQTTKLKQGLNEIKVNIGSKITFTSANSSLYNLVAVDIDNGKTKQNLKSSKSTPSLLSDITIDGTYNIDLYTETNLVKQNTTSQFSIELANKEDSAKRYNINSNVGLPISLIKSGKVEQVTAYINKKTYRFDVSTNNVITIPDTAFDRVGNYKTILVPYNSEIGDGTPLEFSISGVEEMYVGTPDIRNIKYPTLIKGADYIGADVNFTISYDSVNTDFVKIKKLGGTSTLTTSKSGIVELNFKQLYELDNTIVPENDDKVAISLVLTPYNISGFKELAGKDELITINLDKGDLTIPREVAINRIAEGFISQLDTSIFVDETSKYLTHLLHLGNGNNKVITTWTGSVGSLIVKLYEPLPTTTQPNQQVWISKLQSNPIVETVTLSGEVKDICPPLKGPNFSLNPESGIGYKIFNDLIASGSQTSTDIVNKYLETSGIDTSKLNITYVSGSDYLFNNFINFSSAEERVNNFLYKIELLENYSSKYNELLADEPIASQLYLTNKGVKIDTINGIYDVHWETLEYKGIAQQEEAKKILNTINSLIQGMDGFEKFLYSDYAYPSMSYPKDVYTHPTSGLTVYILKATSSNDVTNWYDNLIALADDFDKYNPNYLVNNIPTFIKEDYDNSDFILFLDMIGQHFDIIWVYINNLKGKNIIEEKQIKGATNTLIYNMLESMGWEGKRAFDSQFLWEYAFGTDKEGVDKYSMPLEDANNQVWRRILNNLPYLLKHKGTSRAMKAVMACYGVPQSMLTIMEFGGPQDPAIGGSTKFTYDDRTAAIKLNSGSQYSSITIPWKNIVSTGTKPHSIEFRIKPDEIKNTTIISGSDFSLSIIPTSGSFVKLELNLGQGTSQPYFETFASGSPSVSTTYIQSPFLSASILTEYILGPDTISNTPDFPLSTEYYSNILLNEYNLSGDGALYEILLKTSDGQRIITNVSMSFESSKSPWISGSTLSIGNDFSGDLDEFRLWSVALQPSKFENHTLHPDAINGNSYTASTADLMFRLDFEYPKDRTNDKAIKNVALNTSYGENFATASNMYSASSYPYQYTPYDRTVTATVPSLGLNYSNKIRFEEQQLIGDLSYKARATKKSFDRAPIDSNRLGIFFSPIKELNMDIVKAFGDFNIDNYIGDPSDEYKNDYRELADLRKYYFQRLDRNMNEYIQLVRYIDKSLFDVLTDLSAGRANVSKGLLIEPHYLERSKTRWDKPTSIKGDYDTTINANQYNEIESSYESKDALLDATEIVTLVSDLPNYETLINAEKIYTIESENSGYDAEIPTTEVYVIETEYPTIPQTGSIEIVVPNGEKLTAEVDSFTTTMIGMNTDSLSNAGFGLYGTNGNSIVSTIEPVFGNYEKTGSRKSVFLVKEQYTTKVSTQTAGWPVNGALPGEQVLYEDITTTNYRYKVSVLPFSGSITIGNNTTEVTALNGYFPTHYKFVNNLSEGLQNSYWKGSLQSATTTPDGLDPVEIFTTNPNILKVSKTGRGSGEPILIVE